MPRDPGAMVPGPGGPDGADVNMDTGDPTWRGDLGAFIRHCLLSRQRHLKVRVQGAGAHAMTPVRLPDGFILEVRVDPTPGAEPPSWYPAPETTAAAMIELHGGALVLSNVIIRHNPDARLDSLLALDNAHLVMSRCRLMVQPGTSGTGGDLVQFLAPTTQPIEGPPAGSVFQVAVDRPICRLMDTILIANRTALRLDLGRGLAALTGCAIASDETAIELNPGQVARGRFQADLWLERSTLVAGHSIIGLGRWPALGVGPYRPWVVNSRRSAFLTLSDARSREAAWLRVDADAMAGGCLYWQADGDAFELDHVAAAGEAVPSSGRSRDLMNQWVQFWGSNRHGTIAGPRSSALRLRERPRPGGIEPADLLLDPSLRGQGGQLAVGADLAALGIQPRSARPAPARN